MQGARSVTVTLQLLGKLLQGVLQPAMALLRRRAQRCQM